MNISNLDTRDEADSLHIVHTNKKKCNMILEAVISASKLMVKVSKEKIGIEWLGLLIEVEISFFKRNIEIFDDIRERKACVSNINLIFFSHHQSLLEVVT